MKKIVKIIGIIIGSLIGLLTLIIVVLFISSKTLGFKYETQNPIYPPNKQWTFLGTFISSEGKKIRSDTLFLKTYNERFFLAISQNKITWTLKQDSVSSEQTTGIIENENRLWMHPLRLKDYIPFTEYSAFPEIRMPIEVGNSWDAKLMLGSFATEETGSVMTVKHQIILLDTLSLTPLNRQVKILGTGISGLGEYKNEMTFNEKEGFTKWEYTKSTGDKLIIELLNISDIERF